MSTNIIDKMAIDINKTTLDPRTPYSRFHSKENAGFDNFRKHRSKQWLKDKFCKDHAWAVLKSEWTPDMSIDAQVLFGKETRDTHSTYDDICQYMNIKKFKFTGPDSVNITWMTQDEIDERDAEKLVNGAKTMKKWKAAEAKREKEESK